MNLKSKALIYLLVVAALFTACKPVKKSENIRPNILFFLIDDQRNDVISCAGHPIVKTPAIDRLAKDGIRFTNAFVTTSICAASRASIFTGLYECEHNYTFGTSPLKKEFINSSYPLLLKDSGYNTGFIGKLGVKLEEQDSMLAKMYDYYELSPQSVPYLETLDDGSRRHSAEIKGDQAIDYINNQTSNKPFCLSISFNAVHAVDGNKTPGNKGHYPYPDAMSGLYEDLVMPEPLLSDPEIYDNHPEFFKNSMNRERYFWRWDTEEKYQTNMRAYFRMISGCDKVINRVINALKEKDLDRNTVIIYSADNGYYMGNRGFAGKWSHYEESLRVPLIIYDPRAPGRGYGKTSDKMALNIDIPATILDYAGISPPQIYQGKSLATIINNENAETWRDNFLCEHRMEQDQIPKYVGIRGERYVYANYYEQDPPYEFLHDLKIDPYQLENLVNHPDYKEALYNMRNLCKSMEEKMQNP